MGNWVLLYDTTEKNLARDLRDLVKEIGLELTMIPYAPDRGTLEAKEEHYMNGAPGLLFLITAGSERDGKKYPSPSVAAEMGRAQEIFKGNRDKVNYLVEHDCNIQAIDQQTYVRFDRTNISSVLEALAQVVRNLRAAGALSKSGISPSPTFEAFAETVPTRVKQVCSELSRHQNGWWLYDEIERYMSRSLGMDEQERTFAKHDLQQLQLAVIIKDNPGLWKLTPRGVELAKYELKKHDADIAVINRALDLPRKS